jgi:hypothetical protein
MSHDLYVYGATDPIFFKATLEGRGVPSLSFQDADVKISKDGHDAVNAASHGTVAETSAGLGWYTYTPVASVTQCEVLIINVEDAVGSAFDENGLVIAMGGHASARFSG